jgi:hypothetical protein
MPISKTGYFAGKHFIPKIKKFASIAFRKIFMQRISVEIVVKYIIVIGIYCWVNSILMYAGICNGLFK